MGQPHGGDHIDKVSLFGFGRGVGEARRIPSCMAIHMLGVDDQTIVSLARIVWVDGFTRVAAGVVHADVLHTDAANPEAVVVRGAFQINGIKSYHGIGSRVRYRTNVGYWEGMRQTGRDHSAIVDQTKDGRMLIRNTFVR